MILLKGRVDPLCVAFVVLGAAVARPLFLAAEAAPELPSIAAATTSNAVDTPSEPRRLRELPISSPPIRLGRGFSHPFETVSTTFAEESQAFELAKGSAGFHRRLLSFSFGFGATCARPPA